MAIASQTDVGLGNDQDNDGPNSTEAFHARAKEIRNAQRNTYLVRMLRVLLPVCSTGVVLIYGVSAIGSFSISDLAKVPLALPGVIAGNLKMDNPRYRGFNDDGGQYVVAARSAKPNLKNTNIVLLDKITGELTDSKNLKTKFAAERGTFNTKNSSLRLLEGITVVSDDGIRANLRSAFYHMKSGVISSNEPVSVEMPTGKLTANKMKYWQKKKEAQFSGDVVTLLTPPKADAGAKKEAENNKPSALFGNGGAPVVVKSKKLRISDAKNIAIYEEEVTVTQDETSMSTRQLEVYFSGTAPGGKKGGEQGSEKPSSSVSQSRQVDRIVSRYPILIKRGVDQQVTGQTAEFMATQNKAIISGNVVITSGQDQRATGQRVEFNAADDTALLSGDVVVRQSKNEMRGGRLFVDRKHGLLDLTSPTQNGAGRIHARLEGRARGKSKSKNNSSSANKPTLGIASFKTSPGAPIDIEADRLDVDNTTKKAIFRGKVKAKQGTFTIHTSMLIARYKGDVALDDLGAAKPKDGVKGQSMELTQITAKGNVIVKSVAGQSATGDWGEFDLVNNTVVVGGDVVLTRGQSVVRGSRLKIDMKTGETVIDTSPTAKKDGGGESRAESKSAPGAPNSVVTRSKRPSAVFYPNQIMKAKKKNGDRASKKKTTGSGSATNATSQPDASSSWKVQTAP